MAPKRHKRDLITRAELARRKGCTRGAVTRACQGPLRPACVGRLVDAAHPLVQIWRVEADGAPTSRVPNEPQIDVVTLAAVNLRRAQAQADHLESRIERDRGLLVSRELVRRYVFGHLDELHRRLLTNAARTISTTLRAHVQSGAPLEELVTTTSTLISGELRKTVEHVTELLRSDALAARGRIPPVTEIRRDDRADERTAIDAFARRLSPRLREECAPRVVTAVAKAIARSSGADGRLDPQTFERVIAASETCKPESIRQAAAIMVACVESTLSQTQERTPHAAAAE